MDFAHYWFSGLTGEGPGPGFSIGNSLRFRGQQSLNRTFLQTWQQDITFSAWIKRANFGAEQYFLTLDDGSINIPGIWTPNNNLASYAGSQTDSTAVFRDPSAWYHVVITNDTAWINGQVVNSGSLISGHTSQNQCYLGVYGVNANTYFEGYMAEVYLIDGQSLQPTAFAAYNDDGVWVPIAPAGLNYGANGYHLDFSDPNDIGADRSGNGNDFTPTGFDTDPVGIFSNDLTTNTSFDGGNPPSLAFDGNTGTFCQANGLGGVNASLTYAPTNPIGVTSLEVFAPGFTDQTITFGGTTSPFSPATSWVNVPLGTATEISTSNPLVITRSTQGEAVRLCDIRVNGVTLVDNTGTDYDLMLDSPTQNWSTLNSVVPNNELEDASLRYNSTAAAVSSTPSTVSWNTTTDPNNYYCEFTCITQPVSFNPTNIYGACHVENADWNTDNTHGLPGAVTYSGDGRIFVNGSPSQAGLASVNDGDVLSILYNSGNRDLTFFVNDVQQGNAVGIGADLDYVFVSGCNGDTAGGVIVANFGQRPFIHQPNGTVALQTQNLPAAPIANGRDHFQAITDAGANILTAAQTAFPNGLWWIKDRVNSNQHQLVDSVRGGNLTLQSNSTAVETAYVAPSGDSVAWCWKAGGAAVTNNDGSIASQVSANTDAGFSVVTYTGNGTAGATVGHGLNSAPEFLMIKARETAHSWAVYHSDVDATAPEDYFLILNSNAVRAKDAGRFNDTTPSDTVFTVGNNVSVNNSGRGFIAYAWHSVPGYSAIGSYTGNSDDNGPFLYTGFRPAWVLIKNADQGGSGYHWQIQDTTRCSSNPNLFTLSADITNPEALNDNLDLLSNGFKLRTNAGAVNGTGNTMIYAAFAENPFQSPATAR